MTGGRLPSGEHTTSDRKYVKEWRALADAVERVLDARVYGYDPHIAVFRHDGTGAFTLPVWAAEKIAAIGKEMP